jgi:DNA invertase Pin-like site-specific DNA recombinase
LRVAIYSRVSTNDKGQDPENQLRQPRDSCVTCGHTIAGEYIDYESGRTDTNEKRVFRNPSRVLMLCGPVTRGRSRSANTRR